MLIKCCGTESPRNSLGRFSRASSSAGAPIVNLPCFTTTISGQPLEQSRNDVTGAGVCACAGANVTIRGKASTHIPYVVKTLFMRNSSPSLNALCCPPNADLNAALFNSPAPANRLAVFSTCLTARLRRPLDSHVLDDGPAHWTICREEPAFTGKVTCGVRNET